MSLHKWFAGSVITLLLFVSVPATSFAGTSTQIETQINALMEMLRQLQALQGQSISLPSNNSVLSTTVSSSDPLKVTFKYTMNQEQTCNGGSYRLFFGDDGLGEELHIPADNCHSYVQYTEHTYPRAGTYTAILYSRITTGFGEKELGKVTIRVGKPGKTPSCEVWTNKKQVAPGEQFLITWTTKNIDNPWMFENVKAGGEHAIKKRGSMRWTAESASGTAFYDEFKIGEGEGSAQNNALCTVVVRIVAPDYEPTLSLRLSPATITSGEQTQLTWKSQYANGCILQYDGQQYTIPVNGTRTFSPTQTTEYKILCTNDPGTGKDGPTVSQSATVTVNNSTTPTVTTEAPTCTITTQTKQTFSLWRTNKNKSVNISWTSTNASYATWVQDTSANLLGLSGDKLATSGNVTVSVDGKAANESLTASLTVFGTDGRSATCSARVNTPSTIIMNDKTSNLASVYAAIGVALEALREQIKLLGN